MQDISSAVKPDPGGLTCILEMSMLCCVAQETQTGALYQPRGVGWGGRFKREGMYVYLWLIMLRLKKNEHTQFIKCLRSRLSTTPIPSSSAFVSHSYILCMVSTVVVSVTSCNEHPHRFLCLWLFIETPGIFLT